MPPVGFEPAIPAGERPQTYALDSAAAGICQILQYKLKLRTVADHFSIVVCQVCWRQLRTVYQRMFRNRWRKVGGVVRRDLNEKTLATDNGR